MLVVRDGVLGNLATFELAGRRIERVAVRSDDTAKRVLRLETSVGDIGIRFGGEARLLDGDVIHADAERVIAVAVTADDVLVFRPATIGAAIDLAHALGNRHLPILRDGETIVVRYDPLLEALGFANGVPVEREARIVRQPFLHAHAPHTHAHD
jgi:urease accessory protein